MSLFQVSASILAIALTATSSLAADRLQCENVIDVRGAKGQTWLSYMQTTVKPALDAYATEGYEVASASKIVSTLNAVSSKVKRKALQGAGGSEAGLRALGKVLEGKIVTLYSLPGEIRKAGRQYDMYDLSTYIGLASCGGAILQFDENNFAYNIHYGSGAVAKDERTGRSFGAGAERLADDASDKAYLTDLQAYVTSEKDLSNFYRTLVMALANTDVSGYSGISEEGRTLLTDFLAVYTAEQDRNLMDGRITLHWDAALLEVTLMAAFHAGQKEIALMYLDPISGKTSFTSSVVNQAPGCDARVNKRRKANLTDYWQFSKSTDPANCKRSGINITKEQFRALGTQISNHMRENHPELVEAVESKLTGVRPGGNLFQALSQFFINPRTKAKLGTKASKDLADAYAAFLAQVQADAKGLTSSIFREQGVRE